MVMQVEHKTEQGVILFVDVPDDANSFTIEHGRLCFNDNENMPDYRCLNKYGFTPEKGQDDDDFWELASKHQEEQNRIDKFVLIGLTSEVTEGQAKTMLPENNSLHHLNDIFYRGYESSFRKALPAFKSIMNHLHIYEVNPYKSECHCSIQSTLDEMEACGLEQQEHYKAQERTSKRVVLFKPNEK